MIPADRLVHREGFAERKPDSALPTFARPPSLGWDKRKGGKPLLGRTVHELCAKAIELADTQIPVAESGLRAEVLHHRFAVELGKRDTLVQGFAVASVRGGFRAAEFVSEPNDMS